MDGLGFGRRGLGPRPSPSHLQRRIHLGFSAAQVRGDGIEGFNKLGLYGGAVVDIRRFQNLGLPTRHPVPRKRKQKGRQPQTGDYSTWAYKFSYIDIPLVAVVELSEGYTVGTGLQPGVLLSALEDGLDGEASRGIGWTPTCPSDPGSSVGSCGSGCPRLGAASSFCAQPKPARHCPQAEQPWPERTLGRPDAKHHVAGRLHASPARSRTLSFTPADAGRRARPAWTR